MRRVEAGGSSAQNVLAAKYAYNTRSGQLATSSRNTRRQRATATGVASASSPSQI